MDSESTHFEKRLPKYQEIAQALLAPTEEAAALRGKTQLELAEEFGVNRQTVRHALDWMRRGSRAGVSEAEGGSFDFPKPKLAKVGFPIWVNSLPEVDVMAMQFRLGLARDLQVELSAFGFELDVQCVGHQRSPHREKIAHLCTQWEGVILEPFDRENQLRQEHPFESLKETTVILGALQGVVHQSVCPDFYGAAQIAIHELARCGARRILYTGPSNDFVSHKMLRLIGMENASSALKLELAYTEEGASAAKVFSEVKRFFAEGNRCDAILADTGYSASGAIRALADLGISVPGEVQVIAIGRSEEITYMVPRPTMITGEQRRMAREVAAMMDALVQRPGAKIPNVIVPMALLKGETTLEPLSERGQTPRREGRAAVVGRVS